jgi:putative transposase
MLTLSHYRFEQHLKQAASRKGVIVALVNESYTSKTCPNCGHIHVKLGGNKKFQSLGANTLHLEIGMAL